MVGGLTCQIAGPHHARVGDHGDDFQPVSRWGWIGVRDDFDVVVIEWIANPVTVAVGEAVAAAVVAGGRVGARTRVGREGVVVASRGVLAADHFERIANAVAITVREAVAVAVVAVGRVGARTCVGSRSVIVASGCVLAADHFERIAHPVAVAIGEAVAIAVVAGIGKDTSVVQGKGRGRIIVASDWKGTSGTRFEVAASVIFICGRVEVAGCREHTTGIDASTIVLCGCGIVVEGFRICATKA